ncbi:MAG: hypothetical protein U1F58_07625 [Burkholderiales bacterium]
MALKFAGAWRFEPPPDGKFRNKEIPGEAVGEFSGMIAKIATQGDRWRILEYFKGHYCAAIGATHYRSSSESWAETDLDRTMSSATDNAPLFVEAFFDACEGIGRDHPDWFVPDADMINRVLRKHEIGYEIRDHELLLREQAAPIISVDPPPPTLAEMAVELFQASLARSDELLAQGHSREAVQEVLWLLETTTTAFRGVETESGSIQGKYFNQIARELRAKGGSVTLERAMEWITTMHGYLSSPSGGGVRHGLDLRDGVEIGPNEALLFTNLIRSYLSFLLAEHERLSKR